MSIVRVKQCLSSKVKHPFVPIEKMVVMHLIRIVMPFIIVMVGQIILSDVQENYNGMIEKKNADGNHPFIVVHRKRCYLMKINSIRHFALEKQMGKTSHCCRI